MLQSIFWTIMSIVVDVFSDLQEDSAARDDLSGSNDKNHAKVSCFFPLFEKTKTKQKSAFISK